MKYRIVFKDQIYGESKIDCISYTLPSSGEDYVTFMVDENPVNRFAIKSDYVLAIIPIN